MISKWRDTIKSTYVRCKIGPLTYLNLPFQKLKTFHWLIACSYNHLNGFKKLILEMINLLCNISISAWICNPKGLKGRNSNYFDKLICRETMWTSRSDCIMMECVQSSSSHYLLGRHCGEVSIPKTCRRVCIVASSAGCHFAFVRERCRGHGCHVRVI